ncbi:hypothetical protein K438DRAFT_535142 [Mycena galopus ATCC 62051]|nr:hypothetical protein K438DRAFT_535142 [Mycena galopus ATCC 62051]
MTPTSGPAFAASIEAAIRSLNTVKYCCVAGIAWMVYDILINLDREVKHFWVSKFKWSFPRVLYFLNRYFALASVAFFVFGLFHPLSTTVSTVSIYVQTWTGALEIWFLQAILIYRVNALYRTKKILISILVFFLSSAAAVIAIITTTAGTSKTMAEHIPGLSACVPAPRQSRLGEIWAFWVPILVFESYLFALALLQLVRNVEMVRRNALLFRSRSHLVELILRDSIWYFLLVCLIDISSLIIWQSHHGPAGQPGTEWTTGFTAPFFSITGTRLLLNLREHGDFAEYISTGGISALNHYGTEPHSAIQFAERAVIAMKPTFEDSRTAVHITTPCMPEP